jgi:biopolymer transport protein ExbB/TolQ
MADAAAVADGVAACNEGFELVDGECIEKLTGVMKIMDDGGIMMWVILAVSVAGMLIFFERAYDLYFARSLSVNRFLRLALDAVKARRFNQAVSACNVKTRHPLVAVVKAGVLRANRREKEIERAMEKEMLLALPHLQKRIGMVALLANMATLIGLLGTIMGLMSAFESVAAASATERQTALANGISEAMYTTAFGILVAVLLLFVHHLILKRSETIVLQVEGGASATLVALTGPVDEAPPAAGR